MVDNNTRYEVHPSRYDQHVRIDNKIDDGDNNTRYKVLQVYFEVHPSRYMIDSDLIDAKSESSQYMIDLIDILIESTLLIRYEVLRSTSILNTRSMWDDKRII
jgi:hypothetical protein